MNMPLTQPFQPWLDQIWEWRHSGRFDEAFRAYLDQCERLAILPRLTLGERKKRLEACGATEGEALEFLLLPVSFSRRQLELADAESTLAGIQRLFDMATLWQSYQLAFQKGLNHLCRAERAEALPCFAKARHLARGDREYLRALFNLILCLEDLGHDYAETLAEFTGRFLAHRAEPWAEEMRSQCLALEARTAYRLGDCAAFAAAAAGQAGGGGDQSLYYLALIAELPIFRLPEAEALKRRAIAYLVAHAHNGYLSSYHLRTLSGVSAADDDSPDVRPTEVIERLYSWTWAWLLDADPQRLHQLVALKDHTIESLRGVLSPDDYLQLQAAILWFGLFLDFGSHQAEHMLANVTLAAKARVPVLEYELLLLEYCYARRDAQTERAADCRRRLSAHPLHAAPGFLLAALAQALLDEAGGPETFAVLVASLQALFRDAAPLSSGINASVHSGQIAFYSGGKKKSTLCSAALANLLFLAARRDVTHLSIVLQSCFNLPTYRPERHLVKISKLIGLANKKFAPIARFKRKGDYLFADIDAGALQFRFTNPHSLPLLASSRSFSYLAKGLSSKPRHAAVWQPQAGLGAQVTESEWLTRRTLESLLGCSTTTAVKRINAWQRAGRVVKRGVGKSSQYQLDEALKLEILKGLTP